MELFFKNLFSKKIVILGADGFIGSSLVPRLLQMGAEVISISGRQFFQFPRNYDAIISKSDCLINLCGENIGSFFWSSVKKKKIQQSRIELTKNIVDALKRIPHPPKRFLCTSAVGYYGDMGEDLLTEISSCGIGFLPQLCSDWEVQAQLAETIGVSTCCMRLGIVLDPRGGMLCSLKKASLWGRFWGLGNKRQWISWVYMSDLVDSILFLILKNDIRGPINIVGGSSLIKEFYQWASVVLGMRFCGMLGGSSLQFVLFKIFGSSMEMFFSSQNVSSKKLKDNGFFFQKNQLTN